MNKQNEEKEKLKLLSRSLNELEHGFILVEGLKDKSALIKLGYLENKIFTMSGNLVLSLKKIQELADQNEDLAEQKVYVLADLDRRGEQQAQKAKEELEANNMRADIELRRIIGRILNMTHFEEMQTSYSNFMDQVHQNPKIGKDAYSELNDEEIIDKKTKNEEKNIEMKNNMKNKKR